MDEVLRAERPGDEPALDQLLTRGFRSSTVAGLVRLLRQHWPGYDPGLSVVACDGDQIVGHVLGLTARLRLHGAERCGMSIGPVCVDPGSQRRGLGGRMLAACHDLGRRAGAEFVILEGVPTYYPRYGYRACWAFPNVTIDREALPKDVQPLVATPVAPADLPWLHARLAAEIATVDFGWQWPETLDAWSLPGLNCVLWRTAEGRRAAYTLCRPTMPWDPPRDAFVLADDPALARAALAALRPATLAHHPAGWLAREVLDPAWATLGERPVAGPCMAFELVEGALGDYYAGVEAGTIQPGLVNWPLPFLMC